jgi:hypothetical protein
VADRLEAVKWRNWKVVVEFEHSFKKHPPTAPGTPDPDKPPSDGGEGK